MSWLKKTQRVPVVVHTDGSCLKNPGGAGGWAAVFSQHGSSWTISGSDPSTTNNRMELMAAIKALEFLPDHSFVYMHTDSQYVKKGIVSWVKGWKERGWKTHNGQPVANVDLWQQLEQQESRHTIVWMWVRGHDGNVQNEKCDRLANAAARRCKQLQGGDEFSS